MNALDLTRYFSNFKSGIIGDTTHFDGPFGSKKIIYADWTASGRLYDPIEEIMRNEVAPLIANTHTETNHTGTSMTLAYKEARAIIKNHVNATKDDVLICTGSGMTGAVNKFQRILGLKIHEKYKSLITTPESERPVVFITHMEHHSNQTSWNETIADVVIIPPTEDGLLDIDAFHAQLDQYKDRPLKIAAITSCSNVTGIRSPYYEIAKSMHRVGGYCFADFACSAPYIDIDMHPEDEECNLDAIYFSPHKFLGGPGTTGILIFNKSLYKNEIPDDPGGGTVDYTNPWGESVYHLDIEDREDGGTPAFLQTIRTALCIKLKEEMSVKNIMAREHQINDYIWTQFDKMERVHVFADQHRDRLGVYSFFIENLHFNLGVKMLNDLFGIQVRGGCSCAGTYGHYLFEIEMNTSHAILDKIKAGDLSQKPGWLRMSIHPTMTDEEVAYIMDSIAELSNSHEEYAKNYVYNPKTNEFAHKEEVVVNQAKEWFTRPLCAQ